MKTKAKFNPWLVVLGALGCNALLITLANLDGFYLQPVMDEFGWSRTAASLYMSIYNWVAAVIQIFVGKLFEKYDIRKIMCSVIVVYGAVYIWSATFTHLWQWTLFGVIYGVCAGFFMYIPGALLVTRWFKKSTGLAMSIPGIITGIIGLFINPIAQSLIEQKGWGQARIETGLFITGICFVLTLLFAKNRPEDYGLRAYGEEETEEKESGKVSATAKEEDGLTCKEALHSPALYLSVLYTFLVCVACCFVQQIVSFAGAFPVGAMAGAFALSVFSAIGIPRTPVLGWVTDHIGSKVGNMVCSIACAVGSLMIFTAGQTNKVMLYLGVALFSFMFFPLTNGTALMVGEVFGRKEYSAIYSYCTTSLLVAGGVAPLVYGQIFDRTQSYASLPIFVFVVSIVVTILTPLIYTFGRKSREQAEKAN